MGKPTIYQIVRQTLGRAFRETGQALDRVGIKGRQMALTKRVIGDDPLFYQDHLSRHRQQMPLLRRGRPVISSDVAFLAPCATLIGSVHIGKNSSIFYKSILRADNCDNADAFRNGSRIGGGRMESIETNIPLGEMKDDSTNDDAVAADIGDGVADQKPRSYHSSEWDLDLDRFTRNKSNATGGGIFIGEDTNIQDNCIIDSKRDHTRIGNGVTVGHLSSIHSATIHDHCVIGMGVLVQEGVTVEEESFIAAGANVPKNTTVKSGELWVGNPAKKLRQLTSIERARLQHHAQAYVGVASNQKEVMSLGGNLPQSLAPYLSIGNEENNEDFSEENNTSAI